MTDSTFTQRALSETLAQFRSRVLHDGDFAAFKSFPNGSVNVILDVGANRGQSIASFRTVLPDSRIHAFEANPAFFDVLTALIVQVPGPLDIHRHGLGRGRAQLRFYIPWVGQTPYLEESSTRLDYFDKPWVVEKYRERGPMRLEEIDVEVRAGDELSLCPDLIKIDVEGAEYDVLMGMQETIERGCPSLLIENSDWHNVTPFLQKRGYKPYRWEPEECGGFVDYYGTSVNTFYLHPSRLDGLPVR